HVEDRIKPALAGRQSAIVLVSSVEDGLKVVDAPARQRAAGVRSTRGTSSPGRTTTVSPVRTVARPSA
ncbi:hypothetical protein, partial [Streptomyces zhihengii]